MGGKSKTSQRTKNNARPSSSGRSAELLQNAANVEQYFTAGSGKVPVLFPSLQSANIDQGLTPEYSVCFKKFNKKDPVTKIKALQEFTELVKTGNVADAEAALPSWTHHYQFLSFDSDHRVREATQLSHGAVLSACGRRAAPQLRRLLPVWLLALHDEHAPAAAFALAHLQNTFPEGKLIEALLFCKSEIVTMLNENLTGNAESMIGRRAESEDERQMQLMRVLGGSLHALALLLRRLPAPLHDWLWDDCAAPLLQHAHYWRLARDPAQHVRSAWYEAMGCIVERFAVRIPLDIGKKAVKALLAEPERSAGIASQRWAALALLTRHVEDWHTWLEKEDLLISRLLDLIENDAWGEARLLAGLLVPLLAGFPRHWLTKDFYSKLFAAMFIGLNNKNLLKSKSERQTWTSNMAECLRYLTTQNEDFVVEVITYVHRTWVERVLDISKQTQTTNNLISHSMINMSSLVKYWLNQSKADSSDKYDQLIRNFWQNVCSTILIQIDTLSIEQADIVQSIEAHTLLLKTLRLSFLKGNEKKLSIKFEDQKDDASDETAADETDPLCDAQLRERFTHNLNDTVQKVACSYFDFAHKKQVAQAVFPALMNLLIEFDNRALFVALAKHFGAETVHGFCDRVLRPWLAGDTMRTKVLSDVMFLLIKYLTEEEQDTLFNSFQQFSPAVVNWCIHHSLTPPQRARPATKRWLRGPVVAASVLALCKRDADENAISLLLACLAYDEAGEPMAGAATVSQLVQALGARLAAAEAGAPAALAERVVHALAAGPARPLADPLLQGLFRYRLQLTRGEAGAAAGAGVPRGWRAELAAGSLRDLRDHVYADLESLNIKHIESAASFCPHLFGTTDENEQNLAEIVSLSKQLFTLIEEKQPAHPLELYALRSDCIHGNITIAFERSNELFKKISSSASGNHEELSREDLIISVYKSLFRIYFLRTVTQNMSDENANKSNGWCNFLLSDSYFKEELSRSLYEYAVTKTLHDYYAFWPHYEIIKETKQKMESLLEDILNDITVETKEAIYSFLTQSFVKEGFYWQFARKLFDLKYIEIVKAREIKVLAQKSSQASLLDSKILKQKDKLESTVTLGEKSAGNIHNDAKIDFDTAQDNGSVAKTEQRDSNVNPEQNFEAKYMQRDSENVTHKMNTADTDLQSKIVKKIYSVINPGPKDSKTAKQLNVPESKPEQTNIESKLKTSNTGSTSQETKSESEQSISESTSEHDEARKFITKSEYVEQVQWTKLLGFPSLHEVVSNGAYYLDLQVEAKYSPDKLRDYHTKFKVMMRCLFSAHMYERDVIARLLMEIVNVKDTFGPDPVIRGYHDYSKGQSLMLFDRLLVDVPWLQVTSNAAIADFLGDMVYLHGRYMSAEHWDFVNIALSCLLNSIAQSADQWASTNVATLFRAVARLFCRVHAYIFELRCFELTPSPTITALLREWDEIFAPDLNRHLFSLLLAVLRSTDTPTSASSTATISSLMAATQGMEWELLDAGAAASGLSLERFTDAAIKALTGACHHNYKYLAFNTLQMFAKHHLAEDAHRLTVWAAEETEGQPRPDMCFELISDAIQLMQNYTEAALANVKLCEETCEMVPFSDSHRVALGYLLLATAYMELCSAARGDLHQLFIVEFRDCKFADGLMSCTLRLLPEPVAAFTYERGAALTSRMLDCFRDLPDLNVYDYCSSGTLSAIACHVLKETLGGPGAADARSWSCAAPVRVAAGLRRLVPVAITPLLLQQHLTELRDCAHELRDTRLSIFWNRGEVKCWLAVEETELEMSIRFAPDHPLSPPDVVTPSHSPAPATSWIVLYLAYQNGTLLNALKMWIQAVNSRMQDVPQCYVCYCRLHPNTGRVPNVRCHQCRNKFHNLCLRKWFQHSHKSNCPLCRTKF